ncbi:MAG: hypothetical protein A2070_14595 [Bdellovibrionales bacterium GWC1_52_8]|nr:MAG: hypothetical protein A2070_14595 [Bdellovibrionales bacterium GWC1_52_8]
MELFNAATFSIQGDLTVGSSLTLYGTSRLIPVGNTTTGVGTVLIAPTVTIGATAAIDSNGQGYGAGGPGNGMDQLNCGGGASYGGFGTAPNTCGAAGTTIAAKYGSLTQPVSLGSGGGLSTQYGGARNGGGAIKIVADSLAVNGALRSNGLNGPGTTSYCSGGGSGGSIWLEVGTLSGNGPISANGGTSPRSTNAGGGRIAIYYQTKTYTGSVTASATSTATAGTVYMMRSGKYISPVMDFGSSAISYETLAYTATTPTTSSVSVDIRAGNTLSPDGSWTGWSTIINGGSLAAFVGNRYLQYRATLGSEDASKPSLDSITINTPSCYSTGSYYYVKTSSINQFKYARSNTLSNVLITSSQPGSTALKSLVSFDGGSTWKKHNGTTWIDAAGGVSTVGTMGNTIADLSTGLTGYTFGASEPTLDFAFGLETDSCSATPSITELRFDY